MLITNYKIVCKIFGSCEIALYLCFMELAEQIKANIAAQKAVEKINLADQFKRFAEYFKNKEPQVMAGCDNLDNDLCRAEEIRLLNHENE